MIHVAAAVIENERGELLIARRRPDKSQGGLWEFPGGKLEAGESMEACLKRELQEEMGIAIEPYERLGVNDHWYGDTLIRLIAYRADYAGGGVTLTDHDDYRWASPTELDRYEFAPADVPFVHMLQDASGSGRR